MKRDTREALLFAPANYRLHETAGDAPTPVGWFCVYVQDRDATAFEVIGMRRPWTNDDGASGDDTLGVYG
jgi:hypothetical protein